MSFRGSLTFSEKRGSDRERQIIAPMTEGGRVKLPATQDLVLEVAAVLPTTTDWQLIATTETNGGPAGLLMRVREN